VAPIKILWNAWADAGNVNSQSLTARELAARLDPERFASRLFVRAGGDPDPRLRGRDGVRLIPVPRRLGMAVVARELLWGDRHLLFYPALNLRASRLFYRLRRLGRRVRTVHSFEVSWRQLAAVPEPVRRHTLRAARDADLLTAITPAIVRDLGERGLDAELMPLGVDLSRFAPVDRRGRPGPAKVLFVASILERKQPHLVLELARRLRSRPVEFHLLGPVLEEGYYRRLLAEKERDGLDRVFFHGKVSPDELARHLRGGDLYLLPSRLEGFGKTTLEAAARGLPAVVFDDYETPAVVDGETGFAVATFEEMAERVERLLDDPALRHRLGDAAAEHAAAFSWDRIARRWEERFERLLRTG